MTTIMPLFNQLSEIIRKHRSLKTGIDVMHTGQLFKLEKKVDLFILDEADELTRTIAVKFDESN